MAERDEAERPFIEQLKAMGWTHLPGKDVGVLDVHSPFLTGQFDEAVREINRRSDNDAAWMDPHDLRRAKGKLASVSLAPGVREANFATTDLLHSGCQLNGVSGDLGRLNAQLRYFDWHPGRLHRNNFTVVDQLGVRSRSGETYRLDLVLFVNGIPLVAVECKSPDRADPVDDAVTDLRDYTKLLPELFRIVQLLVAATGETAHLGTVDAATEHYHPWRSVEPVAEKTLRGDLDRAGLTVRTPEGKPAPFTEQEMLVGVVLRPADLLTIVRHYLIPLPVEDEAGNVRKVKAVCRHQQYRAAEKAVHRLLTGRVRGGAVLDDERGGVVWHTQGSGKSLTMTFLVRRVHLHHKLDQFMVLVVTDRTQLQRQLAETLEHSESKVETAKTRRDVEAQLKNPGGRVVFAMIQKYGTGENGPVFAGEADGDGDERSPVADYAAEEERRRARRKKPGTAGSSGKAGEGDGKKGEEPTSDFPRCTDSSEVLVLVDEAHRSHTSMLHVGLRQAAPRAARIGFTGTPIIRGAETDTARIFSGAPGEPFLDSYTMQDAEEDGVVVRIRYEGRTGKGEVLDGEELDRRFEDLVRERTDEEKAELKKKYPTERDIAESVPMIEAKAEDILEHWVTTVQTGGFKAQLAAVSRQAAVAYREALVKARDNLLRELESYDPESIVGIPLEQLNRSQRMLHEAYLARALLRRIEFVPVISGGHRKDRRWREWTDEKRQRDYIARFLKAFPQYKAPAQWSSLAKPVARPSVAPQRAAQPWFTESSGQAADRAAARDAVPDPIPKDAPIAFLIVKSMLLTGFDAPREQVLYLDRPIRDAELLQAVARVNRPSPGKEVGYVVDYYGVFEHLTTALADYADVDIDDTMRSMSEEAAGLEGAAEAVQRHLRDEAGIDEAQLGDPARLREAVLALGDERVRFEFDEVLHAFLAVVERVLPHEEVRGYIPKARRWSALQKRVRRHYRDGSGGDFTMRHYGRKVRAMIADHLQGPEIESVIPPVLITTPGYDERVRAMPSEEAAAEMAHAADFFLREQVRREDPEKYERLSKRVAEILEELPGRFEEQVAKMWPVLEELRQQEETDPELAHLTSLEAKVCRELKRQLTESPSVVHNGSETLPDLAVGLCDIARQTMGKAQFQDSSQSLQVLAAELHERLMRGGVMPAGGDFEELDAIAESLAAYARGVRVEFMRRGRGH